LASIAALIRSERVGTAISVSCKRHFGMRGKVLVGDIVGQNPVRAAVLLQRRRADGVPIVRSDP
jgi:hypothetical protein